MSKEIPSLLSFEEAQKIIKIHTPTLKKIILPLQETSGYVLGKDMTSTIDIPNIDTSMVDGYAVALPVSAPRWHLVQKAIKAGDPSPPTLKPGEAVPIFTGAPVPPRAAIVPIEEGVVKEGILCLDKLPHREWYIRKRGVDLKKKEQILPQGSVLGPAELGLLASAGIVRVPVYQKPRVALLTTGDELIPPGRKLKKGQVYESNAISLMAAVRGMGLAVDLLGHVGDDPKEIWAYIKRGMVHCDCMVVTGGASVGKYDFTQRVFDKLGVAVHFERSAIKPGKPTIFGTKGKKLFFGLPGNPVAALVTFEVYVRPALYWMMGAKIPQRRYQGILTSEVPQEVDRLHLIRGKVIYNNGKFYLEPVGTQISSRIKGVSEAQCLIHIPPGSGQVPQGSAVEFQFLSFSIIS